MTHDQKKVQSLYQKLLCLYPPTFREQFRESIEQMFNDLFNERKWQTDRGLLLFVLWIFIETAIEILREWLLLFKEGDVMKSILTSFKSPAIISFLLIFPFIIMEVINRRDFNEGFPTPLFIILWLLPLIFILTVAPVVRNFRRSGSSIVANPIILLIRLVLLSFIVWMWFGIVIDQMPCFLGVPNCD